MKNVIRKVFIIVFISLLSLILINNSNLISAKNINIDEFEIENELNIYNISGMKIENQIQININEEKGYWSTGLDTLKSAETNNQIGKTLVDTVFMILEDPNEVNYGELAYDTITSIVNVVASCYGLGGVTQGLFDGLKNFGVEESDPIGELKEQMNAEFEKVHDELEDIKDMQMYLSEQINNLNKEIMEDLKNANNAQDAGNYVRQFFDNGSGNFSYTEFKNYLYGDSSKSNEAYYDKLTNKSLDGYDNYSAAKKDIDNLFRVLESEYLYTGDSNIDMLYSYILYNENSGKESIQHYYYDYLKANKDLLGDNDAQLRALEFLLDVCKTAYEADQYIYKCIQYQKSYLDITKKEEYIYGSGDYDKISYDELLICENEIIERQLKLEKQIIKDIVYILNFDDSYIMKDSKNNYHTISDKSSDNFGIVKSGQTIFLNQLSDLICEKFAIDKNEITYSLYGDNKFVRYIDGGLFSVTDEYKKLSAVISYKDIELATFDFYKSDNDSNYYYGGTGHKDNPLLIGNTNQFINLMSNLDVNTQKLYYELVDDLNFYGLYYKMIGELNDKSKQFKGVFDGNGFTISNVTLNTDEYIGLFACNKGTIKNLNVKLCYLGLNSNDKENSYAGIICAKNEGIIENCHVEECKLEVKSKGNNLLKGKTINTFVGGIAGESKKEINYSSVINTKISAESIKKIGDARKSNNINNIKIGGIAGITQNLPKSINYCYVDSKTNIYAFAKTEYSKAFAEDSPIINVDAGGIVSNVSYKDVLSNVLCETTNVKSEYDTENSALLSGEPEDKCSTNDDYYAVNLTKDDKENIVNTNVKELISKYNDIKLDYSFETINEKGIIITNFDSNYGCYKEEIYKCNDKKINLENFKLKVNNENVNFSVLNIYNFNTSNIDKENYTTNNVTLLVGYIYNNEYHIGKIELKIVVLPNSPKSIFLNPNINTQFSINTTINDLKFDSNSILLYYDDDTYEDITHISTIKCDSIGKFGLNEIEISYENLSVKLYVMFNCIHDYTLIDEVQATCENYGYNIHKCKLCNYENKTNYVAPIEHIEELVGYVEPTCYSDGYSGDYKCSLCGTLITEGYILNKTNHNLENNENGSHKCTNKDCTYYEQHYLTVMDYINENNKVGRLYNCYYCDYQQFEEYLYDEYIPRIAISNSYVLPDDKKAVVFVKLFENSGLTGVKLSLMFDNSLKLLKDETINGNIFNTCISAYGKGVASFALSSEGYETKDNGLLLKLVFELPENININDSFEINICTPLEEDFTDKYANPLKLATINGTINVVEHLPADVNNDKTVDILDVVLIHQYIVIKANADLNYDYSELNNFVLDNNFNARYADVDLDFVISMQDLVIIMQSIIGINSDEILSSNYDIVLNTNDGNKNLNEINIDLYETNIKYYNEFLDDYRPYRDGYKFIGWSTDINIGEIEIITDETKLSYNKNQKIQTLYAIWEKNNIIFDLNNGYTTDTENNIYYIDDLYYIDNEFVEIPTNIKKEVYVYQEISTDPNNLIFSEPFIINYKFIGWASKVNPDTIIYYEDNNSINIKNSEIGNIELIAIWEQIDSISDINFIGYKSNGWSYDSENKEKIIYDKIDDNKLERIDNKNCLKLYNDIEIIPFTINYINMTNNEEIPIKPDNSIRDITNLGDLSKDAFKKSGHELLGWSYEKDRQNHITSLDTDLYKYLNDYGQLNLYAVWNPITYTITYKSGGGTGKQMTPIKYTYGNNDNLSKNTYEKTGYYFNGWSFESDDKNGFADLTPIKEVIDNYIRIYGEENTTIVLYPCWPESSYTITYKSDGNIINVSTYLYNEQTQPIQDLTKTNYAFLGWIYSDSNFKIGNLMPATDITATANWVKIKQTIIKSADNGYRDKVIDDGEKDFWGNRRNGSYSETIYPGFDRNYLDSYNFDYINITINFDIYEQESGYQIIEIYSHKDALLKTKTYESGGDGGADKNWRTHTLSFQISINDVQTDGSFWIKYKADGSGTDKWKLGYTEIIVEATKMKN